MRLQKQIYEIEVYTAVKIRLYSAGVWQNPAWQIRATRTCEVNIKGDREDLDWIDMA
jgi:hypothetical protein